MGTVRYLGGLALLVGQTCYWAARNIASRKALSHLHAMSIQMVRVGVRSVPVVVLVQVFIGVILALQMYPPLKDFEQQATIANIVGVAGFRMLGPIITAVVLTGFAGASIAAEMGTMVVAEEIEAMQAMALDPIRYLVVPRVVATVVMMVMLSVIADLMIALGGYITSSLVLGPEVYMVYWAKMQDQLKYRDFYTGLIQAGVFGLLISLIACREGLKVSGGAEGVGRATTMTVVYSIFAIIISACLFTMIFYAFKL